MLYTRYVKDEPVMHLLEARKKKLVQQLLSRMKESATTIQLVTKRSLKSKETETCLQKQPHKEHSAVLKRVSKKRKCFTIQGGRMGETKEERFRRQTEVGVTVCYRNIPAIKRHLFCVFYLYFNTVKKDDRL